MLPYLFFVCDKEWLSILYLYMFLFFLYLLFTSLSPFSRLAYWLHHFLMSDTQYNTVLIYCQTVRNGVLGLFKKCVGNVADTPEF